MILTHDVILKEMKKGNIKIEPRVSDAQIGPGSVDLHVSNVFRRFKHHNEVFEVTDEANFEEITEEVVIPKGKSILIKPNETVLGITRERVTLSPGLSGWIEGRSRFARIGLAVHITSGFAHPGISNFQVLEITNLGPAPLALHPGTRLCQFIIQRCEGEAQYQGRFNSQVRP